MQPRNLFSLCLLGAAVTALPGGSKHGSGGKGGGKGNKPIFVDANFDDLTAAPLDLNPVGEYDYLYYDGFSVGSEYLLGAQLFGVTPSSPPNVAYSNVISSTFAGPALQANYTGSKTKAFDLKSFYYACIDVSVTPVATAGNCTVYVSSYRGDQLIASQQFDYAEDNVLSGDLDATMDLAKLSKDFRGLTEVTITYNTTNIDTPPSFIGDDFKYNVYVTGTHYTWPSLLEGL